MEDRTRLKQVVAAGFLAVVFLVVAYSISSHLEGASAARETLRERELDLQRRQAVLDAADRARERTLPSDVDFSRF